MSAAVNVAIVGATGAVGQEFLTVLAERDFPIKQLKLLASARSAGKRVEFRGETYTVEELTKVEGDASAIQHHRIWIHGGEKCAQGLPRFELWIFACAANLCVKRAVYAHAVEHRPLKITVV